ncbi:putative uncharacterized protein DDB_G0291608 [Drosophila ananassae]|uniref:putative uncharacterized protein DDB_G0291608 n=1 Tax=Drosophila ananassae TaxID=7217 RepID=UPI001CFF973D|nr:putative uncharacterized protein DDB_G0291608 [Drosophila ananassae]
MQQLQQLQQQHQHQQPQLQQQTPSVANNTIVDDPMTGVDGPVGNIDGANVNPISVPTLNATPTVPSPSSAVARPVAPAVSLALVPSSTSTNSTSQTNVRQQSKQHQRQQRHQWQHQHQHHQRQYRRQPGRQQPPQRTGSLNYWQPLQTYDRNSNGQANSRSSQNPSQQQQEQPQNRIVRNPFRRNQPNNSNAFGLASRPKNPAEAHLSRFQAKLRAERTGNLAYARQQRSPTQVTPNANRGQSQSLSQQKGNYVEVQNSQVNKIQQNYAQLLKLHIRTQARLDNYNRDRKLNLEMQQLQQLQQQHQHQQPQLQQQTPSVANNTIVDDPMTGVDGPVGNIDGANVNPISVPTLNATPTVPSPSSAVARPVAPAVSLAMVPSSTSTNSTSQTNVRQQSKQHQRQQRHQWQHQHQQHQRQHRRQPGRQQPPQRTGSLNYWQPLQTYDRNSNGQANSRSSQNPSQQQQEQPQNRIVRNPFRRSQPNNSNAYGLASRAKNPAEAHLSRFQAKLRAERTGNLAYVRQQRSSTQVTPNANRGQSQSLSQQKGNYVEVQNSQVNKIQQNYAQLLKLHIRTQARLDKESLTNTVVLCSWSSADVPCAPLSVSVSQSDRRVDQLVECGRACAHSQSQSVSQIVVLISWSSADVPAPTLSVSLSVSFSPSVSWPVEG